MNITYEEALSEPLTITKAKARAEIEKHGADWSEWIEEAGDHETYTSDRLLIWLGY